MSDVHAAAATTCCANLPPGLTGPGPTPLQLITLLGCFGFFSLFFLAFFFLVFFFSLLWLDSSLPLGPHGLIAAYGVVVLVLVLALLVVLVAVPYLSLVRALCYIQHWLCPALPSTC